MSSDSIDQQRNELEALAEDYVARKRRGERPSLDSYINEHPELAEEIRELFPVVEMLDQPQLKQTGSTNGSAAEIGPGTRLGEYQLIRRIGRGGMGVVYQAEHVVLGSQVAIKVLPSVVGRHKMKERFLREASVAARMHHRNIVRVFDFGTQADSMFYVMALVDGCGLDQLVSKKNEEHSLQDRAKTFLEETVAATASESSSSDQDFEGDRESRGDTQPDSTVKTFVASTEDSNSFTAVERFVTRLGIQAADALGYAHSMDVIHRDIKPANLMLDGGNQLYITDFGLAKVADSDGLTATGDVLGTLRYMAPEAFRGQADHLSDVYSLGLTLYELLADQPAFGESDRAQLFQQIAEGKIPRLRSIRPNVSFDLATIIHKSIQPEPSRRYRSAFDLRDDLQRFLDGRPVSARRTTWMHRSWLWIGRNRAVSSLGGGMILILAIATVLFGISAVRFERLAEEKEAQRVAAETAKGNAIEQTRRSQLNLFSAKLSDAQGWSTSLRPGQRANGIASLHEAIGLARELQVFESNRDEINQIAASLSALVDVPLQTAWTHPFAVSDKIGFSSDLTHYACEEVEQDIKKTCKIYKVAAGEPQLLDTIPIRGTLGSRSIRLSDDATLVAAPMWHPEGYWAPWIFNRRTRLSRLLDIKLVFSEIDILSEYYGTKLYVIGDQSTLVEIDGEDGKVNRRFPLPGKKPWTRLIVNDRGDQVAVYKDRSTRVSTVSLASGKIRELGYAKKRKEPIQWAVWSPDGRQIAFTSTDQITRIWDEEIGQVISEIRYKHERTDSSAYVMGNRLFATGGWDYATIFHDPLSRRQVMRCEGRIRRVATDGKSFILQSGRRFERRKVLGDRAVSEYFTGAKETHFNSSVSAATGLAWVGTEHQILVIDIQTNRILAKKLLSDHENIAVVDPLDRDVFFSNHDRVFRMPVSGLPLSEHDRKSKMIQIGPAEIISQRSGESAYRPTAIKLSSNGDKLAISNKDQTCEVVLDRGLGWQRVGHVHVQNHPYRIAAHTSQPLIATSVHHSWYCNVVNTKTEETLFSLRVNPCQSDFSPDGKELLVCGDGCVRSFEVGSWNLLRRSPPELALGNHFMNISTDGRWIAVQSQSPKGVAILDGKTLEPALILRGNHVFPQSLVGRFDSTGRFLVADRGKRVTGIWDFHLLRRHFESLDLPWPLPGLGNPTPLRDPSVKVKILWDEP